MGGSVSSESLHRIKKKCKKMYFFCDLFCRLKKNAYLCVSNKGKGLHPSSDPEKKLINEKSIFF